MNTYYLERTHRASGLKITARCIESKNSVKTVSVILGHSNITTMMNLYVHPDNHEKNVVLRRCLKIFYKN